MTTETTAAATHTVIRKGNRFMVLPGTDHTAATVKVGYQGWWIVARLPVDEAYKFADRQRAIAKAGGFVLQ